MDQRDLRKFLNRKTDEYNRPSFIAQDPVSIPHRFSKRQDIEIAGFFAAIFSWGHRTIIIRKTSELMALMDNAPHQFVLQHGENDLRKLLGFRHRTFNATDLLYFVDFFKQHYTGHDSLEDAFLGATGKEALTGFYHYFFSLGQAPPRTYKHIASPEKNSSCKRLNMFLRWMVRKDDKGVDFGIWQKISPSSLICPLDVHVARVARRFGLLTRTQTDWQAAQELTDQLLVLDKDDPVKYDFALFGLGVMEKF
ncbi:MAG TPA: TIGR02757 family protein [Puia sp.]|nr:TIGR02757 family protein [Puia sp.]